MPPDPILIELENSFRAFYRTIRKEIALAFSREKITNSEFLLLRSLSSRKSPSASEVAGELGVSPAYVTALTEKMIRKGLVERSRSESDRRSVLLGLTTEGRELFASLDRIARAVLRRRFQRLSQQERKVLHSMMQKLEDPEGTGTMEYDPMEKGTQKGA